MDLYKNKYRIKSTRLENWDYSSAGYYFVTICVKNSECLFGNISNDGVVLTEIGNIAERCWLDIPQQFINVELDEFIIMPNHIHGIIAILNRKEDGCNVKCEEADNQESNIIDIDYRKSIHRTVPMIKNNPMYNHNSLSAIVRWYKGRTTFEINRLNKSISFHWLSRFYDHIIRDEKELFKIREYIVNNPLKWVLDDYYSE